MKANKKLTFSLTALASLVSISLLGTVAGSLAWYAYSQNVTLSYTGTSVSNSSLLNVGLIDNGTTPIFSEQDCTNWNLERKVVSLEDNSTTSIVFSKSRHGFSKPALEHYLTHTRNAVTTLYPVTTNERALNATSNLELYKSPEYSETSFNTIADTTDYVTLPFAFRVLGDNSEYIANKNIWLTESKVKAERGLEDAIRVYVDGKNKFLMKPAEQESLAGSTKVGGVLDLDGDGYYDYNGASNTEYLYGKFSATGTSAPLQPGDEGYDSLSDVNGTNSEAASTFYAKHKPGVTTATFTPLEAKYYSFGKVAPKESTTDGSFYEDVEHDEGKAIAVTSSTSGVAFATLTIFIEGWDHSVIDRAAGYSFSLDLRFEVDRA